MMFQQDRHGNIMLLFILAACFTLSAGQTTGSQIPTPSSPAPASVERALIIAVTTWQSHQELNETTISPLVQQLQALLLKLQPQLDIQLTLRKIQKV